MRGNELGIAARDREWFYHPRPWKTIEWLEIYPHEIVTALKGIGVPISLEADRIRIWSSLRPGAALEFAWHQAATNPDRVSDNRAKSVVRRKSLFVKSLKLQSNVQRD